MIRVASALVVLAVVLTACGGSTASTENAYGTPQVTGASLASLPNDTTDPAVGSAIPSVTGADFEGSVVEIDPANGTPKVILFLAHWCSHCQDEVPAVQDYFDANSLPDGVEFVSVATSTDPSRPNFPPSDWLERESWIAPVVVDDEARTVANAFGLTAFPFWVVVGPDGTVLERVAGSVNVEALPGLFDQLSSLATSGG